MLLTGCGYIKFCQSLSIATNLKKMEIPTNITKDHLLQAISKIDVEGIPSDADSHYYDVVYKEKKYPPKLIVSYSNLFANGEILNRNSFNGGLGTECFRLLEENGFAIIQKNAQLIDRKFWIEKTLVTGRVDRNEGARALGKALWTPQKSRDGSDIYKNMRLAKKNDVVLHLIDNKKIVGISLVKNDVIETTGLANTEWDGPAYLIELERYTELNPPIDRYNLLNNKNQSELLKISSSSEVFVLDLEK